MQDLILQEQFELEVLELLNSGRVVERLLFVGGTMLRLCYGLDRFSVDLDFWLGEKNDADKLFAEIKALLEKKYQVKDAAQKFYTLLFEIRSSEYPRSLKIEIRKEPRSCTVQQSIAYSRYSDRQVLMKTLNLEDMMRAKLAAFVDRQEVRDAFDIEFLLKKNIALPEDNDLLQGANQALQRITEKDLTQKLGPLVDAKFRDYYRAEGFKIFRFALGEKV